MIWEVVKVKSELKKAYKEKFEELEESLRRYDPERNTFYYFKKRDYRGNFEEEEKQEASDS